MKSITGITLTILLLAVDPFSTHRPAGAQQ